MQSSTTIASKESTSRGRAVSLILPRNRTGGSNNSISSRTSNSSVSSSRSCSSIGIGISRSSICRRSLEGSNRKGNLLIISNSFAFLIAALTLAALLILTLLTNEAQALNCYTCSSADNPACDEQFAGRDNFTDTDCEKHIGRPAKVCRKIIQYIEDKKVVIRSCGWIDEHADAEKQQQQAVGGEGDNHAIAERKPMCYKRSGTFALMMESCVCYEDNCNHSASLVPNLSVIIILIGSYLLVCLVVAKDTIAQFT